MRAVGRLFPILLLACPAFLAAQRPLGGSIRVDPPAQVFAVLPHLATNPAGEFVVTWFGFPPEASNATLFARRYAADGRPATGAIRVSTSSRFDFSTGARTGVAMRADGSFVVAFPVDSENGSASHLVARWYAADGTRQRDVVVTNDRVELLSIATRGNGGVALAWQVVGSIRIRSFGPDLEPLGPAAVISRWGLFPAIAVSPGGGLVVAWQGFLAQAGSSLPDRTFVGVQRLAADGSPLGSPKDASGVQPVEDFFFVVHAGMDDDGNFLVVWGENSGIEDDPTFARRFTADGTPIGGVLRLGLGGRNFLPSSLAVGGRGNFVLTWEQPSSQGGLDISARRFAADGSPLGPVLPVNQDVPGGEIGEQVGIGADGGFIVAWSSDERIFARRFQRR
jgi:hypothetical protein